MENKGIIKILYISTESEMGGGEWSLLYLAERLDKKKFLPIVVCPSTGTFPDELEARGIRVIILPLGRIKTLNPIPAVKTIIRLIKIILTERIHLIHANAPRANLLGGIAGRLTRRRVIWHARNFVVWGMVDTDKMFSFLTDRIIANSVAVSKRFKDIKGYGKKVSVVYNGVGLEKFNPGIDGYKIKREFGIQADVPLAGILSRMGPGKGQEYFMKAASIVKKSVPNIKFIIAGDAVLEEERTELSKLVNQAKELKLCDDIIFTGYRSDIPDIMASLDLVVLATEAEPFGRVAIEAMAMAKPVIATNAGGIPEVVKDNITGILVPPKDVNAMAKAIVELLNNRKRMDEMGARGRERVSKVFSIENNVKATEEIYRALT